MIDVRKSVPTGMKVVDNEKRLKAVEKRLNDHTEGYCPCVPESIGKEEYKCPCLKARTESKCCCGIYESK